MPMKKKETEHAKKSVSGAKLSKPEKTVIHVPIGGKARQQKQKMLIKIPSNKRPAGETSKSNLPPSPKNVKTTQVLEFEYSGKVEHISRDPRACANLFWAVTGPFCPLPLSKEVEEEDGYQYVSQLMVKVRFVTTPFCFRGR